MTGMPMTPVSKRVMRFDGCATSRPRFGGARRLLADQAEPALAPLVAADGGEEIVLGEVGPEPIEERQLRVRRAVEQEVRDAELAAGADDEIRIAHAQVGQARAQRGGVYGGGIELAGGGLDGELARGGGDLLAPA